MTTPVNRIDQAAWLELARRQSQTLAQTRASTILPFCWEPASRPAATQGLGLLRTAWVLPVLAVIVLGGATATLAFVHHLREVRPAVPPRPTTTVTPAGERPLTKRVIRHRSSLRRAPVVREKTVKPLIVKRPDETPAPNDPKATPGSDGSGSVIFGPDDMPGGEVIIVNPPRKQPPLWTPEAYKKERRGTLRW